MEKYCVRVVQTAVAHVEVEASSKQEAERKASTMLGELFSGASYEYDYDVSGQGEYENHTDIGL
jgi:hypothetical protein